MLLAEKKYKIQFLTSFKKFGDRIYKTIRYIRINSKEILVFGQNVMFVVQKVCYTRCSLNGKNLYGNAHEI